MEFEFNFLEQGQNLIRHGGVFIWCIVAVSVAALVISIERFWMLQIQYRIDGRKLFDSIKRKLIEGNIRGAEEICESHMGIPLAQLMRSGVSAGFRRGQQQHFDVTIESELSNFIPLISQRLNYLPSLANVATLFGLLGTIAGLIVAFKSTGGMNAGAMNAEQGLASGIALAMYNTAFGLVVAIPTTLSYLFLSNRANALMDDLDRYASALKRLSLELGSVETKTIEAKVDVQEIAETPKVIEASPVEKPVEITHEQYLDELVEEKTVLLDQQNRISVTQAISIKDITKPFSEETAKLFVTAAVDQRPKSPKREKNVEKQYPTTEDMTDELTSPEMPGVRK